jgi:hypothetical protein
VAADEFEDLRGAPHVGNAVRGVKHQAKFGFVVETGLDHGAVAGLKDVQGKVRAGKKNDVEWKERNAIWPHESQSR